MTSSNCSSSNTRILYSKNELCINVIVHEFYPIYTNFYSPETTYWMYNNGVLVLEVDQFDSADSNPIFDIVLEGPITGGFLEFVMESPIPIGLKLFLIEKYV